MRSQRSKPPPDAPPKDADTTAEKGRDSISKSEMKRRMTALQNVGEALVALSSDRLKRIELPPELREAVVEAKRINAHGGKKRQMQYIGRLMREIDAAPIVEQLERLAAPDKREVARQHLAEKWRLDFVATTELPTLLAQFASDVAPLDPNLLAELIARAKKERAQSQPPRAFREIYHVLKTAIDATRA